MSGRLVEVKPATKTSGLVRKAKGSSYKPLPSELRHSRNGLINIKNFKDNKCLTWCYIRFNVLQRSNDPGRITKKDKCVEYTYRKDRDTYTPSYPVRIDDIPTIEREWRIKVNVFSYDRGRFYPIYIGDNSNSDRDDNKVMNLLLITEEDSTHYILLKNISALLFRITKHKENKHICLWFLQLFSSERELSEHKERCLTINGTQSVRLPKPSTNVKFENYRRQLPVPFVIYADFKSILVPTQEIRKGSKNESYTHDIVRQCSTHTFLRNHFL